MTLPLRSMPVASTLATAISVRNWLRRLAPTSNSDTSMPTASKVIAPVMSVRLAPLPKLDPVKSLALRLACTRLLLRRSAPSTWALVRVAPLRVAPLRIAPLRIAPSRKAPVRLAPLRMASVRLALLRLMPCRLAPLRFTPVRSVSERSPPANTTPCRRAPERLALARLMPPAVTPVKLALLRLLSGSWAARRLVAVPSGWLRKSAPLKLVPLACRKLRSAPRKFRRKVLNSEASGAPSGALLLKPSRVTPRRLALEKSTL